MKISVIIPFYNESEIMADSVARLYDYGKKQDSKFEFIFVDDHSSDDSKRKLIETLSELGFRNKESNEECRFCSADKKDSVEFLLLSTPDRTKGKGGAVRMGALAATGKLVAFTDCDLAYGTKQLGKLIKEHLDNSNDVTVGVRRGDGYCDYSKMRRFLSNRFHWIVKKYIGYTDIDDTQAGLKCFDQKSAKKLFSNLSTNGPIFDLEILILAQNYGMKVMGIPASMKPGSKSVCGKWHKVLKDGVRVCVDLIKIKKIKKKRSRL